MAIKKYYRCILLQRFHAFSLCILENSTSFPDFFLILHDIPSSVRDLKEETFCVDDLKAPLFHSTMVLLWILDSFFQEICWNWSSGESTYTFMQVWAFLAKSRTNYWRVMWNFVFVLIQVWIYLRTATVYGHLRLWIITIYNFDVSRLDTVLFWLEDATIDAPKAP